MLKKINLFLISGILVLSIVGPLVTYADASPETKAGNTGITYECTDSTGKKYGECTFNDLVAATIKLVNWGMEIAIALSVIVIAWAGYIYMTSGGNPGKLATANGMLLKVVQGIAIMMAAWLIVQLIASVLVTNPNVPTIIKN